jgi:hypothetical protein
MGIRCLGGGRLNGNQAEQCKNRCGKKLISLLITIDLKYGLNNLFKL